MRFLRFARRHPLALLGVLAAAFVTWIWWDGLPERHDQVGVEVTVRPGTHEPAHRLEPPLPEFLTHAPPQDVTRGLAKLKPGMARAEVEKLVGAPATNRVSPAAVTGGRVTYHVSYEADLGPLSAFHTSYEADVGPPHTIRPLRSLHVPPMRRPPESINPALVTLEFDATKAGHPLLEIHYPDPLF